MTYNNIKISVIIPVYQVEKYLSFCLDSLLNQDFKERYQIILIDLGSTDGSSEICHQYEMTYPEKIFRIHTFPNLGVSCSRNIGLFVSNSEYITFVDGDDFVDLTYLSSLYEMIKKSDADIVTIGDYIYTNKAVKDFSRTNLVTTGKSALLKLYKSPFFKLRTFVWARLYKTSFIKEHKLHFDYNLNRFEDWPFISKALFHAKKVKYCSKPLYFYRQHDDSSMHRRADMVTPYLTALESTKKYLYSLDSKFTRKLYSHPSFNIKSQLYHTCSLSSSWFKIKSKDIYKKALEKLMEIYAEG